MLCLHRRVFTSVSCSLFLAWSWSRMTTGSVLVSSPHPPRWHIDSITWRLFLISVRWLMLGDTVLVISAPRLSEFSFSSLLFLSSSPPTRMNNVERSDLQWETQRNSTSESAVTVKNKTKKQLYCLGLMVLLSSISFLAGAAGRCFQQQQQKKRRLYTYRVSTTQTKSVMHSGDNKPVIWWWRPKTEQQEELPLNSSVLYLFFHLF